MAEFKVVFSKTAAKEIGVLSAETRLALLRAMKALEISPFPRGSVIKKLKGPRIPIYRLRVGVFRVIYHLDGNIVVVLAVVNRKDLEKKLKAIL